MSWRCRINSKHRWITAIANRTGGDTGCPICSGRQVEVGVNDLQTTHPELAGEAFGWDPKTCSAGSDSRVRWQCNKGHHWTTTVVNRAIGGTNCPTCSNRGFDPNEDGFLYLLRDDVRGLFQIGITNNPKQRVTHHMKNGWEVMQIQGPMDGQTTRDLETSLLQALRRRGADFADAANYPKFDGWTESWTQISFSTSTISQLKSLLHEN
jgi:hypothetical protein